MTGSSESIGDKDLTHQNYNWLERSQGDKVKILFKIIIICTMGYGSASCDDSISSESIRSG